MLRVNVKITDTDSGWEKLAADLKEIEKKEGCSRYSGG